MSAPTQPDGSDSRPGPLRRLWRALLRGVSPRRRWAAQAASATDGGPTGAREAARNATALNALLRSLAVESERVVRDEVARARANRFGGAGASLGPEISQHNGHQPGLRASTDR
jgi:hypothetical protein